MASEVLFRDVLRIYLSEFGETQEKSTSGIKVCSCSNAMFVIILSVEISSWIDFGP